MPEPLSSAVSRAAPEALVEQGRSRSIPAAFWWVNDTVGAAMANRLGGRSINISGGTLTLNGNVSGTSKETIGTFNFQRGETFININAGSGQQANIVASSLVRQISSQANATGVISGAGLGTAAGPGVGTLSFATAPTFTGQTGASGTTNKGIIPWLLVDNTTTGSIGVRHYGRLGKFDCPRVVGERTGSRIDSERQLRSDQ